jgi:hypothetical protein
MVRARNRDCVDVFELAQAAEVFGKGRGETFIRIHDEDPITRGGARDLVADELDDRNRRVRKNARPVRFRELRALVHALEVEQEDLVCPFHRFEARDEAIGLVVADDAGGDTGSLNATGG